MPYREIALPKALLFLEPGPLTLITTFDGQKNNVMTISWIMPIDFDGGAVMATGPWNYSFEALRKSKECVVCIPAQEMLETAAQIIGKPADDGFAVFSVTAAASVENEAAKLHTLLQSCQDGAIILTDIFGGSATNISLTASKDLAKCHVITGLNLSMLLTAINSRKKLPAKELAEKIEADGKRAVINATELLIKGL